MRTLYEEMVVYQELLLYVVVLYVRQSRLLAQHRLASPQIRE